MQERAQPRAAGEDESLELGHLALAGVDGPLQAADAGRGDGRFRLPARDPGRGVGELGSHREQIALDLVQEGGEVGVAGVGFDQAEDGAQLVQVAGGGHPQVVLGDPGAAQEPGLTPVTPSGVDLQNPYSMGSATTVAVAPATSRVVPGAAWSRWT